MRKTLDGRTGKSRRQRIRHTRRDSEDDSEDVEMSDAIGPIPPIARGKDRNSPIVIPGINTSDDGVETNLERPATPPATSITVGSALRRTIDGSVAMPVMVKRRPEAAKTTRRVSCSPFIPASRID